MHNYVNKSNRIIKESDSIEALAFFLLVQMLNKNFNFLTTVWIIYWPKEVCKY